MRHSLYTARFKPQFIEELPIDSNTFIKDKTIFIPQFYRSRNRHCSVIHEMKGMQERLKTSGYHYYLSATFRILYGAIWYEIFSQIKSWRRSLNDRLLEHFILRLEMNNIICMGLILGRAIIRTLTSFSLLCTSSYSDNFWRKLSSQRCSQWVLVWLRRKYRMKGITCIPTQNVLESVDKVLTWLVAVSFDYNIIVL